MKTILVVVALGLAACASAQQGRDGSGDVDAPNPDPTADACVPVVEACNELDDDCDGRIDEDFDQKGADCSAGIGGCMAHGQLRCNGSDLSCDATAGPATAEQCDGIDNDCDMLVDEDFLVGTGCDGADADTCADGMIVCATLTTTRCTDMEGSTAEVCDGIDNDCDGTIDDGFVLGMACDGADTDACNEGVTVCDAATGGTKCNDTTTNNLELCDGLDNDCKNGIDDTFALAQACTVGLGQCQRAGQTVCNTAQNGTACSATPGVPQLETCGNAVDEDCNGVDAMCPANDTAAGAVDVSAGGTFMVDLTSAHDDNWTAGCGLQGGRDVFYTFSLVAPDVVYFDTFGSAYDSVVRVYDGGCGAIGNLLQCGDNACSLAQSQGAQAFAAGTYCLVVDQLSSAVTGGATTLHVTRGNRVGSPLPVTPVMGSTAGHADLSIGSCEPNSHQPDDAYYFLTCPGSRTLNAKTCNTASPRDTVLYYRAGSATSADKACDDDTCAGDTSQLPATVIPGAGLQWLIVDGFGAPPGTTGVGPYRLDYTVQ